MKDDTRTPLRSVLINFLNHIKILESDEYPDISYDSEFQDLKLFSESVKGLKQYSCYEGEKELNKKKNRYKDILPFDLSRVILEEYAGVPGSDYINANYIKGASGSIAYIASQGPLSNTVIDFWRMVVQCEVQVIVMACNEKEAGKVKCEKYWVDDGEEKQFGTVSVKLLKSSTVCPDFSVRTMRLKYPKNASVIEERTVCQLHYVAWPDHGVPTVVQPLLEMVKLVRDTQASETLPVLIHCSAGCGRTGTICAIDYVWGLLRTGKLTRNFSLLELVREMRRQRISMVQTKEQYVLVHQAVRELFQEQLNMIDSHPYENVDINGIIKGSDEDSIYDFVDNPMLKPEGNSDPCRSENEKSVLKDKKPSSSISKLEMETDNPGNVQSSVKSRAESSLLPVNKVDKLKSQFETQPGISSSSKERSTNQEELPHKRFHVRRATQVNIQPPKSHGSSVKRSKSLKLLPGQEKSLTDIYGDISEIKARALSDKTSGEQSTDLSRLNRALNDKSLKDSKHVLELVKDYEALSVTAIRKPLVRSYTTLDMNQKPTIHSRANLNASFERQSDLVQKTCKITRSHTHLDLKKMFTRTPEKRSKNATKNILNLTSQKKLEKGFPTDITVRKTPNSLYSTSATPPATSTPKSKISDKTGMNAQSVQYNNSPLYYSAPKPKAKLVSNKGFPGCYSLKNKDIEMNNSALNELTYKTKYPPPKDYSSHKSNEVDRAQVKNFSKEACQLPEPSEIISQSVNVEWGRKPYINSLRSQVKLSTSDSGTEPIYINTAVKLQPKVGMKELSPESSEKALELDVTISSLNLSSKSMKISSDYSFFKPVYNASLKESQGFNIAEKVVYHPSHIPRKTDDKTVAKSKPDGYLNNTAPSDLYKNDSDSCNSHFDQLSSDESYVQKLNVNQRDAFLSNETDFVMNGNHIKLIGDPPKDRSFSSGETVDVTKHKSVIVNKRGSKEDNKIWAGSTQPKTPVKNNWKPRSEVVNKEQSWDSAPGVDIDQVAASMCQKDEGKNKLIRSALEALHLRKSKSSTPNSSPGTKKPDVKTVRKHQYL